MPAPSNQRWSLDFVHDQIVTGRRFRVLDSDDVTRECIRAVDDTSISGRRVDDYNTERPHLSLGYATPAAFAAELEQQRAGSTPPVASPAFMRDDAGRFLVAAE